MKEPAPNPDRQDNLLRPLASEPDSRERALLEIPLRTSGNCATCFGNRQPTPRTRFCRPSGNSNPGWRRFPKRCLERSARLWMTA